MTETTSIQKDGTSKRKTIPSIEKTFISTNPSQRLKPVEPTKLKKKRDNILSKYNCVVSVLVENGKNKPKFMRVNELEDLDRVNAIKRKQNNDNGKLDSRSEDNITSPPTKKQFVDNNN